ncbi:Serologically defined colon cancer antigen 3-like protein [Plakobranchus ocellatus]|uniref:Endosome-associated-trafficking regulator 1 n=1 Tax=Plakobranchus ocellatus TaxID=259542 RepID=A0AAV4BPI3_9GAST|nr:Serologically defined colon cancer antigen 3-like protein [Plakobranchus ocellatus]
MGCTIYPESSAIATSVLRRDGPGRARLALCVYVWIMITEQITELKMAEKKDDEDNPFSFKTFVSVKEKKTPTIAGASNIDADDIFNVDNEKSKTGGSKNEKHREDQSSGAAKSGSKKSKPKENPFSFKKFLSSTTSESSSSRPSASSGALDRGGQNPVTDLTSLRTEKGPSLLPGACNVDLLVEPRNGFAPLGSKLPLDPGDDLFIESDDEGATADNVSLSASSDRDVALSGQNIPSVLPDFLSDGAALSVSSLGISAMTNSTHEDLLSQIQTLQEENSRLRKDLALEKQRCSDKNQRLSQLQIDMERQKKKEAEETKVMEKAVLQVEENLEATTKRAVHAETAAVKLKQEVKALQNQVKILTAENLAYQSGDGGLSDIRERTKYTAEQLLSASAAAEKNIKELNAGVEKLKLLSQVLSSLEKVTEVKPETSPEKEPKVS